MTTMAQLEEEVILDAERPFRMAIIPAVAYFISIFSLGILKSWWLRNKK